MPWLVLRLLALKSWLSSRTKRLTTKPVRVGIFAIVALFLFRAAPAVAQTPAVGAALKSDTFLQMFAAWAFSLAGAITKLIVLLIDAMVPIMTYNNFVGNPVVKAGWAIVRDTVNMFFVVILIIIAFGTIFGAERFKWQQQVPRLLIFAIVINFSKTLCGIMIDFGQVIMLTFANALREIAAGNFIQLLKLNEIQSVSISSDLITSAEQVGQEFQYFAAGVVSVLMVTWVLATLVIMVAILLFRIIMLWMLVVIAPLAWFMGAAGGDKGIIKSDAYADWWKEFKCLVGIGPVLAFFLWLTLAVAGAGNIAANSGFVVSANSNNAGFTSSLLQLDNFLSFLIGMAMLFAGFKAASQFCSGASIAGGKIGSMLKQPAAFARTAAGFGAKGGGFAARLGGRVAAGTPGALKAGSRYLPPGVRNLPNKMNLLNAKRRAALSGKVGEVLGDNAFGRYFKGKKADLELGVNAKKFEGVNKEKEAMKDKSRDWKKGQIESMIKSPPRTQAGQDAMTALFEEVMADKRLQMELGPDGMKKLWASQGKKYEDMSKGNADKEENLKGFKKKYAHVTGSIDMLKEADDMKGLAADAWTDEAVREKARRTTTTFEKGKDKDGNKIYMNAFEAAQAGLMGDKLVQNAANEVATVDTSSINEKEFGIGLQAGDTNTARMVMERMESDYTNSATSEADRERMARSMDRMRAAAEKMGNGGNAKANEILASFNTKRKGMETTAGFGLPPVPQTGESGEKYVESNYGQANNDRLDHGVKHFTSQETAANSAVTALEAELQGLETADKSTNAAVAAKRKQIEQLRSRIEQGSKPEIDAAFNDLRAARKLLEEAKRGGNSSEIEAGNEAVQQSEASYTKVKTDAQNELSGDQEMQALEQEIKNLMTSAGSTRGEEVAKKSRELAELKAEAKRVIEVRKALEAQRSKRA
ncbi:MAG: hypothetical protein NUV84_03290 [Candidatus Uhrbacteria bacterium]|nr:hypothetical protein [Candidatus Uhrbacteria bacterium]